LLAGFNKRSLQQTTKTKTKVQSTIIKFGTSQEVKAEEKKNLQET
jgi:hypothetical protein